jgi:hypothetical protein
MPMGQASSRKALKLLIAHFLAIFMVPQWPLRIENVTAQSPNIFPHF